MEYTEEQIARFKPRFKRRRNLQFTAVNVLVLTIAMFKNAQAGVLAFLLATLGVFVFSLYNWRCPACRQYLGWVRNLKICTKCGAALQ